MEEKPSFLFRFFSAWMMIVDGVEEWPLWARRLYVATWPIAVVLRIAAGILFCLAIIIFATPFMLFEKFQESVIPLWKPRPSDPEYEPFESCAECGGLGVEMSWDREVEDCLTCDGTGRILKDDAR